MRKIFLIICIMIVVIGIILLFHTIQQDINYKKEDNIQLQQFFDNFENETIDFAEKENNNIESPIVQENNSYVSVIEIPRISLYTGIVMGNSDYSSMNRNVSIFPTSDMPNEEKGNFILFAHSGTSRISYFNNIHKLNKEDKIYIYYNNAKYTYKVIEKYDVMMNDSRPLNGIIGKTIITLITCKIGDSQYRTIVVGELIQ